MSPVVLLLALCVMDRHPQKLAIRRGASGFPRSNPTNRVRSNEPSSTPSPLPLSSTPSRPCTRRKRRRGKRHRNWPRTSCEHSPGRERDACTIRRPGDRHRLVELFQHHNLQLSIVLGSPLMPYLRSALDMLKRSSSSIESDPSTSVFDNLAMSITFGEREQYLTKKHHISF